jgi:hypothetical protein
VRAQALFHAVVSPFQTRVLTAGDLCGPEDGMDKYLGKEIGWIKVPTWMLHVYLEYVFKPGQEQKKANAQAKEKKLCAICGRDRLYLVHAAFCAGCNWQVHKRCLHLQQKKRLFCQSDECLAASGAFELRCNMCPFAVAAALFNTTMSTS